MSMTRLKSGIETMSRDENRARILAVTRPVLVLHDQNVNLCFILICNHIQTSQQGNKVSELFTIILRCLEIRVTRTIGCLFRWEKARVYDFIILIYGDLSWTAVQFQSILALA